MTEIILEERLRHDLFHSWPYGLRFELSCSGSYVEMFTRALERTLAIARFVFAEPDPVDVVVRCYQVSERTTKMPSQLVALTKCGFKLPSRHTRREHIFHETEISPPHEYRTHYEYTYRFQARIGDANMLAVIWAVLGHEIGIKPHAGVDGYLVAPDRGIVLNPYDDRGMDVVADAPEVLQPIGRHFRDWQMECRPKSLV
jgi:hypothetical protein